MAPVKQSLCLRMPRILDQIVAPIQDLRFDDSLYQFFGPNLIALTQFQEFIPNVETYDHRSIGGVLTPGALIEDFTYTL